MHIDPQAKVAWLSTRHDAQVPSAAAAAGAGSDSAQAATHAAADNGVVGGAVSPAAAQGDLKGAAESGHPQPSQPSMDVNEDFDGSRARQVCPSLWLPHHDVLTDCPAG